MDAKFDVYRKKADLKEGYRQTFTVAVKPGMSLLEVFHHIHEHLDSTFAYRYSCRGAICGSCAVRINGVAGLACKTQIESLMTKGDIVVDPIGNLQPIRDLVVDLEPFWQAYREIIPYIKREHETHDEVFQHGLDAQHLDQMIRAITCIKCGACFSDCDKRAQAESFIGPAAAAALYKYYFDSRDGALEERIKIASDPQSGVFVCDAFAACLKVCPKDVRPLKAINMMRQDLKNQP